MPVESTTCYRFEAGHFLEAAVEGCATGNVIPEEEVVRAGEAIEARQPAATIPRKQLGQPPTAPGEAQ